MKKALSILSVLFTALILASCGKDDAQEAEEFPEGTWRPANEAYVEAAFSKASKENILLSIYHSPIEPVTPINSVIIEKLETGSGTICPIQTDTVRVFYEGRLIPSPSHKDGMVFDSTGFDENINIPTKFALGYGNVIEGFSTAIQNMHVGDKWRVTIPYQLAYGENSAGKVPAYSTLIFTVKLMGISHVGEKAPGWQ